MDGVSMAWKSTMPTLIQNCFAKCSFCIACAVNADDNEKNCNTTFTAPALPMRLLILRNLSLLSLIRRQVWTPLVQTPWPQQLRKRRRWRKCGHFPPSPSGRCSNGLCSVGFSNNSK
jgi:hypothetical protein